LSLSHGIRELAIPSGLEVGLELHGAAEFVMLAAAGDLNRAGIANACSAVRLALLPLSRSVNRRWWRRS
jgi:hypothetical protein